MPSQQTSVLVVDDERSLRKALRMSLSANGFVVEEACNGEEALGAVQGYSFDLVVLDVGMPGISGIDACRKIREMLPRSGIVMVSVRDQEDDKVCAFDAGADDYVTKPFLLRELVARLRAVLRRLRREKHGPEVLRAGDLTIDFHKRLLWRGEDRVHLTPIEFELLAFMMKHSDAALTHVKLLCTVWGPEYGGEMDYLRAYIRMLRKKIESDPATPKYILTESGVGYRFHNPSHRISAAF